MTGVGGRLRALLVDDEPLALTRLSRLLAATGRVEVVGQARDGQGALASLDAGAPDVAFLDIHMPGMTGLELATRLPRGVAVVFTTAYDRHALEAFDADAVDYLLKPIDRKRLERALDRVDRLRAAPRDDMSAVLARLAAAVRGAPSPFLERLPYRTRDGVQFVEIGRVTHFVTRDRLTHAVTPTTDHVVDYGLADLETRLDPAKFFRIHRGALLNLDYVGEIQPWPGGRALVRLRDERRTSLEVARDRTAALRDRLGL